jgi:hypothetical protein
MCCRCMYNVYVHSKLAKIKKKISYDKSRWSFTRSNHAKVKYIGTEKVKCESRYSVTHL